MDTKEATTEMTPKEREQYIFDMADRWSRSYVGAPTSKELEAILMKLPDEDLEVLDRAITMKLEYSEEMALDGEGHLYGPLHYR